MDLGNVDIWGHDTNFWEKTGTAPNFFSEKKGRSPSFFLMAREIVAALMNWGRAPIMVAIFIFWGSGKMGAVPIYPRYFMLNLFCRPKNRRRVCVQET
jgi:hypothetical protein